MEKIILERLLNCLCLISILVGIFIQQFFDWLYLISKKYREEKYKSCICGHPYNEHSSVIGCYHGKNTKKQKKCDCLKFVPKRD